MRETLLAAALRLANDAPDEHKDVAVKFAVQAAVGLSPAAVASAKSRALNMTDGEAMAIVYRIFQGV